MTATSAHSCSCHAAARRSRAGWMLAAFAFVLLQSVVPCHVPTVPARAAADSALQRLIDGALCASGVLRLAGDPATPGDPGRDGTPSALASGCLHCVGMRDSILAPPVPHSWLAGAGPARIAPATPVAGGADAPGWPVTWARGPPHRRSVPA